MLDILLVSFKIIELIHKHEMIHAHQYVTNRTKFKANDHGPCKDNNKIRTYT